VSSMGQLLTFLKLRRENWLNAGKTAYFKAPVLSTKSVSN
jgi:hypothetical protein